MGGIMILYIKAYYISTAIKIEQYWQSKRHTDQKNRIENPEIDPHKDAELIFDKGAKANQ